MGTIRDQGVYTIVETADGQGASQWGKLKSGAGWIALDYVTPNNPRAERQPPFRPNFFPTFCSVRFTSPPRLPPFW
ncbi:MAG: hypothetical protein ACLR1T_00450 [Evtepia gabavorous]